jgi:hypothetical protein
MAHRHPLELNPRRACSEGLPYLPGLEVISSRSPSLGESKFQKGAISPKIVSCQKNLASLKRWSGYLYTIYDVYLKENWQSSTTAKPKIVWMSSMRTLFSVLTSATLLKSN